MTPVRAEDSVAGRIGGGSGGLVMSNGGVENPEMVDEELPAAMAAAQTMGIRVDEPGSGGDAGGKAADTGDSNKPVPAAAIKGSVDLDGLVSGGGNDLGMMISPRPGDKAGEGEGGEGEGEGGGSAAGEGKTEDPQPAEGKGGD